MLLTAALPAGRLQSTGPYDPARSIELEPLAQTLDFINLMTYDMGTAFSGVASFNAPLREVPTDPTAPDVRRWNSVEGGKAEECAESNRTSGLNKAQARGRDVGKRNYSDANLCKTDPRRVWSLAGTRPVHRQEAKWRRSLSFFKEFGTKLMQPQSRVA